MYLLRRLLTQLVTRGTLTVIDAKGERHVFGSGKPEATIRIHDDATARRIFWNPTLSVGEAYMDGTLTFEDCDLSDFLNLAFLNMGWGYGHWLQNVLAQVRRMTRRIAQYNPVGRSRDNVAHHYDLSDQLYDLFLDEDRQYSCAYYRDTNDSLETAQEQKKRHLAAKLLLEPGMKVLDIGSGWGGLGIHLAQQADVDVTGITLSEEQLKVSNRRAADLGLSDRLRFELRDYREEIGVYDRIVSVGMFEHVGVGFYQTFFDKVRDLLTPDGIAVVHTIGRADGPGATNPWLKKYIFPGGYTPALSEVSPHIECARLFTTDVEILRLHYAETLKEWRRRFRRNWRKIAGIYDERFCRMWDFYLAGCEAAFRYGGQVVFQFQMAKQLDAVPMTRDYIGKWEQRSADGDAGIVAAQ